MSFGQLTGEMLHRLHGGCYCSDKNHKLAQGKGGPWTKADCDAKTFINEHYFIVDTGYRPLCCKKKKTSKYSEIKTMSCPDFANLQTCTNSLAMLPLGRIR